MQRAFFFQSDFRSIRSYRFIKKTFSLRTHPCFKENSWDTPSLKKRNDLRQKSRAFSHNIRGLFSFNINVKYYHRQIIGTNSIAPHYDFATRDSFFYMQKSWRICGFWDFIRVCYEKTAWVISKLCNIWGNRSSYVTSTADTFITDKLLLKPKKIKIQRKNELTHICTIPQKADSVVDTLANDGKEQTALKYEMKSSLIMRSVWLTSIS